LKGDFSRSTFRRDKHYSNVRLQQGRVLLDADWNEQVDIQASRDKSTTSDVLGVSGAPLYEAGFELSVEDTALKIGCGRYYVDGILCENDLCENDQKATSISDQPDLPEIDLPTKPGRYVAYLDVWERHITALEDPAIREVALGGPDTTTRTKTVWQVKLERVEDDATRSKFDSGWKPKHAQGAVGEMGARPKQSDAPGDPDEGSAGSGYRRLENQLYRVEIHDGGRPYGALRPSGSVSVTIVPNQTHQVQVEDDRRVWQVGQLVELFSEEPEEPGIQAVVTDVEAVDATIRKLTLDKMVSNITPPPTHLQTITFKWSRDNGTVVTGWDGIEGNIITVSDAAKDAALGFAVGQWVELSDEERTLRGEPGVLVEIAYVQGNDLTVSNWPDGTPPTRGTRPTVRRWDSKGSIPVVVGVWGDLNSEGVQVQFKAGTYRTGDYWTIPARSLNGNVEWPQDDTQNPRLVPPHGIEHHYGPLALLQRDDNTWTVLSDLRKIFAPFAGHYDLHVSEVFLRRTAANDTREQGRPLDPDSKVSVETLRNGIILRCKTKVDPDMVIGVVPDVRVANDKHIDKHMCFVTMDVPFKSGEKVVGFHPLILRANVIVRGTDIIWSPDPDTREWLSQIASATNPLRARLTLKGSSFEIGFWVMAKQVTRQIGLIPNFRNERFLKNPNRIVPMMRAINLAINRTDGPEALINFLPHDYDTDPNQEHSPSKAATEIEHLLLPPLSMPPPTNFHFVISEPEFVNAARRVCEMLGSIPLPAEKKVNFRLEVFNPLKVDMVTRAKQMNNANSHLPAMVICDRSTVPELVRRIPESFDANDFSRF
jgi:hypothetical protein